MNKKELDNVEIMTFEMVFDRSIRGYLSSLLYRAMTFLRSDVTINYQLQYKDDGKKNPRMQKSPNETSK